MDRPSFSHARLWEVVRHVTLPMCVHTPMAAYSQVVCCHLRWLRMSALRVTMPVLSSMITLPVRQVSHHIGSLPTPG
jgi:hypothetical protein